MRYTETHTSETFRQGLVIGDEAIFFRTGDKYTLGNGWGRINEKVTVVGFGYPFIITNRGRFHYSRFVEKEPQMKLTFQ